MLWKGRSKLLFKYTDRVGSFEGKMDLASLKCYPVRHLRAIRRFRKALAHWSRSYPEGAPPGHARDIFVLPMANRNPGKSAPASTIIFRDFFDLFLYPNFNRSLKMMLRAVHLGNLVVENPAKNHDRRAESKRRRMTLEIFSSRSICRCWFSCLPSSLAGRRTRHNLASHQLRLSVTQIWYSS